MMDGGAGDPAFGEVTFRVRGEVGEDVREHAAAKIRLLAEKAPRPVIFARVKLALEEQRPDDEQALAQGLLDVSGALVRAEAAAPTPIEAVDLLSDRLDRRLRRLSGRREDARDRPPATPEGEWRRGDLPDARPSIFPRPSPEREVVRRKSYAPEEISIEEAVFDLGVLDYRFFLFTDQSDGVESIVFEGEDGDVTLRRVTGGEPPVDRPLPLAVNTSPAPSLTIGEAKNHLDLTDDRFVFFADPDTDHAAVLYRRYDGHYGLIAQE